MAHVDLAAEAAALARVASETEESLDSIIGGALDAMASVVPYELASVLELSEPGKLRVRVARGPMATDAVLHHQLVLSDHPSLQRALRSRQARALTEEDHDAEGDPYDGVLDLEHGHSCMVLPLFSGSQDLGLVTFDRTICEPYTQHTVELAAVYAELIGQAVVLAERARLLRRAHQQAVERNRLLRQEVQGTTLATERLRSSQSPRMQALVDAARQVAVTSTPVLITGETGAGKEVLAQAIHDWSPRSEHAFVKINCAALPDNLIESELFGHVKGAFSGADRDRPGRFATANGGSLLLDEVGELPAGAQAKLLRVLQEQTFEPVGSDRSVRVDVRVIAATHVDLLSAVSDGRFRQDLYYRLAVFPLHLPGLRERPEDIVAIAHGILDGLAARGGRGPWKLSDAARAALLSYSWPGNVRELINVLERATILEKTETLHLETLGSPSPRAYPADDESWPTMREAERAYLARVLRHTKGKVYGPDGAARLLDVKPTTLQSRLLKLGLQVEEFRG